MLIALTDARCGGEADAEATRQAIKAMPDEQPVPLRGPT
jgi:hypothetical protein